VTDYDYDCDDHNPDHETWIYLWVYDRDHPLTRFCLLVALSAIAIWSLIQWLAP
jgi:hypothetical protein